MKTVLHVLTEKKIRGGERQALYAIQALQARYRVLLVYDSRLSDKEVSDFNFPNTELIPIRIRNEFDLLAILKIKRLIKSRQVSLIHTHTGKGHGLLVNLMMLSRLTEQVPLIVTKRTVFPLKSWYSKLKFDHPSVSKVICVSQAISELLHLEGVDKSRLSVIRSAIDLSSYQDVEPHEELGQNNLNKEKEGKHIKIGIIGALTFEKNPYAVLELARKSAQGKRNWNFYFLGDGKLRRELESVVRDEGLENVSFLGHQSNPRPYIKAFDLVFHPSRSEGLGTALLDSFALGVPVVGSKIGGIPEIIDSGHNGFLFEVDNLNSAYEALGRLVTNRELRALFSKNAIEKANRFSVQNYKKAYLDLYDSVLEEKKI